MAEKKYADGVRFFERKENQPDFVLGALVITPAVLLDWTENNQSLVSEYKGRDQVKFQVKRSKDGKVYIELDTYKPTAGYKSSPFDEPSKDDLPF